MRWYFSIRRFAWSLMLPCLWCEHRHRLRHWAGAPIHSLGEREGTRCGRALDRESAHLAVPIFEIVMTKDVLERL